MNDMGSRHGVHRAFKLTDEFGPGVRSRIATS
jgi:hypothetical protein